MIGVNALKYSLKAQINRMSMPQLRCKHRALCARRTTSTDSQRKIL
jgi:hypothetical protein